MKRVMTILATALLASGVLATAAEAGGDGYMGALVATFTCAADFGGAIGYVDGRPGHNSQDAHCWYPDEAPKLPPWPPFCG